MVDFFRWGLQLICCWVRQSCKDGRLLRKRTWVPIRTLPILSKTNLGNLHLLLMIADGDMQWQFSHTGVQNYLFMGLLNLILTSINPKEKSTQEMDSRFPSEVTSNNCWWVVLWSSFYHLNECEFMGY